MALLILVPALLEVLIFKYLPLIGIVPVDDMLILYSNRGVPVIKEKSICASPFMNIADRITGLSVPLDKLWRKK